MFFERLKKIFGINSENELDPLMFKLATESSNNHVIFTDVEGKIIYANSAAEKMTGFSYMEMKNNTPRLWGGQMSPEFYASMWQIIKAEKKVFSGEIKNKKKNGEMYEVIASISPINNFNGDLVGFLGIEQDITEKNIMLRDLKKRNLELLKIVDLTADRELKIVELKKMIENKQ